MEGCLLPVDAVVAIGSFANELSASTGTFFVVDCQFSVVDCYLEAVSFVYDLVAMLTSRPWKRILNTLSVIKPNPRVVVPSRSSDICCSVQIWSSINDKLGELLPLILISQSHKFHVDAFAESVCAHPIGEEILRQIEILELCGARSLSVCRDEELGRGNWKELHFGWSCCAYWIGGKPVALPR